MTFYELLHTVEYDSIWECLRKHYSLDGKYFGAYHKAFQDLRSATPSELKEDMLLVVAKVHDEFEDSGLRYEAYGVHPGDPERYALELTPWENWLSYRVLEKSITLYGVDKFVAHALHDLTFFGFSIETARENAEKEIAILNERTAEIDSGKAKCIPAEEVYRSLGFVDERTVEEKRHDEKRMRDAHDANMRIYADLLQEDV